jgi:hypothetical protein
LILHKRESVILVSSVRPQMRSEFPIAHKYNIKLKKDYEYAYLKVEEMRKAREITNAYEK